MANIAKRPDGQYRARYRDAAGKEHAKHFRRKIDAQHWLDNVSAAVMTGSYVDPALSRVTVGAFGDQWLKGQRHLKPSTLTRYASLWACHVAPTWREVPLQAVSHVDIVGWVSGLQQAGLSGSSVRQAHRVLSMVLDLAVKDGRLPRNHADGVKLPRAAQPAKRFLNHREVADLAGAAGPDGLSILLLAYTGLRFGELVALRCSSVDLMRRRLSVTESTTELGGNLIVGTPKSHQARSVPIPGFLVDALAVAMAGKHATAHVFTAPNGGSLRLSNYRRRIFDPAVTAAGLGDLTPHELRHTAASLAVAAGANVKAVQRMLGHASASMTLDVYSGLFDDDLDSVAERMGLAALADSMRTDATVTALPGTGTTP
jgi:integrase